jgi:hypothetical protein
MTDWLTDWLTDDLHGAEASNSQLVKKIPSFYGPRSSLPCSQISDIKYVQKNQKCVHILSQMDPVRWTQSTPTHPVFKIDFNVILYVYFT